MATEATKKLGYRWQSSVSGLQRQGRKLERHGVGSEGNSLQQAGKRWGSRLLQRGVIRKVCLAALLMTVTGLAVLLGIVGWSAVRQNWASGEPWFSGLQLAPLTAPIAAFIAASAAIITARWGLHSARATRETDHRRWEADRDSERQRWEDERKIENARRDTERRDATERTLRDRFHELVKLSSSSDLRAREGAAYAVAALADDWKAHYSDHDPFRARAEQQVCINVLIAQLRDALPAGMGDTDRAQLAAFKQVVQKILGSRLGQVKDGRGQPGSWSPFEFVFDGCTFHDFDLSARVLSGAKVTFARAQFAGQRASFAQAHFTGEEVSFEGAKFTVQRVSFAYAYFAGQRVSFEGTKFTGQRVSFEGTKFTGQQVLFDNAHFTGEGVSFDDAYFPRELASFAHAHFTGQRVSFAHTRFTGHLVSFIGTHFAVQRASFDHAQFIGGSVEAAGAIAVFSRSELSSRTRHHFRDGGALFNAGAEDFPPCEVCSELGEAMPLE